MLITLEPHGIFDYLYRENDKVMKKKYKENI